VIVHTPRTLAEALRLKAAHPAARPLLGGTDLLAQWQTGAARPDEVIALEPIAEMKAIVESDDGITIGAGATHHALAHHPGLASRLPALAEAARTVGAPAVRNMGTIGGNMANASPAADLPPALIVYDAEVDLASAEGTRCLPVEAFFTAYRRVDLAAGELITSIGVRWPAPGTYSAYYKVGTRAAQSIARVGVAGCVRLEGGRVTHVRLAAASVAAVPLRLRAAEQRLLHQPLSHSAILETAAAAAAEITPIDDVRSTAAYRRFAVEQLVRRFLTRAAGS
jgi:CO/xanthine dehydrogenase FAD-binding subunit